MEYQQLIEDALNTPLRGWDWSALAGRFESGNPSWDLRMILARHIRSASALLDLATGGGEFLNSLVPLAPLPKRTVATEGYPPNVPVARARLAPLGVEVVDTSAGTGRLPFPDGTFDLVVSRHGAYRPGEIGRVLAPGGRFVTQQVGGRDLAELNEALGAPPSRYHTWNLASAVRDLRQAGLDVSDAREELAMGAFHDVGAVVLYLRLVPWQIPAFEPGRYGDRLRELHAVLSGGTPLPVTSHRFLVVAHRP